MTRIYSILTFLFLCFLSFGQLKFSTTKYDFGDLEPYSARYVDIALENIGQKEEWILRVQKTMEVTYITSKQIIPVDSTTIIRLHVNPRKKGRFSYDVEIYTSDQDEATKVKLVGSISDLPQDGGNMFTACPSFGDRPGGKEPNGFDLTVVTIDKETREPLSKSKVTMLQGGQPIWTNNTDKKGKIKEEATLGLSYFYATHDGYNPTELGAYVNFKRNYIILELTRNEDPPVIIEVDRTTIAVVDPPDEIIIEIEEELEEALISSIDSTSIPEEVPTALGELDPDDFTEANFDPINVVFVLDVSSSMQQADKIELMKYSLNQLTDMLRSQDKMAIVTYANDARVLLPPTTGGNKTKIKEEVGKLKAFGYTSGGSGIKLGYKQAVKGKISNGKNHVIVITDGAFNRNSDNYKKYVKRYKKKGITLSVIGIKNKSTEEVKMRENAQFGGGRYIPIFGLADAQHNLKQEIRILTFKH